MAITVAMINDLRQRTNAGMMDCKKALTDTNGDMDAAIKILREKGLAIQVKRADKESKEGIICAVASADGKMIAMAEVNTETDFVAKTDNFKNFVKRGCPNRSWHPSPTSRRPRRCRSGTTSGALPLLMR